MLLGIGGLSVAAAMPGWKTKVLGVGTALAMYCSAFSKYKADEITADRFGISHLRHLQRDPTEPAHAFLRLMHDKGMDTIEPKCLSLAQIRDARSLLISDRNPHPYIKDRASEIENWLVH